MSVANPSSPQGSNGPDAGDQMSALFAQLILQQTNMAMMLLGKIAHPETGQVYRDVDAARLFIDQLEMIEAKTKGNLTKDESTLLKQSLMNLRLAFVEAVEAAPTPDSAPKQSANASEPQAAAGTPHTPASASADEEHRKKFSKKY